MPGRVRRTPSASWPPVRSSLKALLIVLIGALVITSSAAGHSSFLESAPRPGARVINAPGQVVLVYTEPLNKRLTTVRLIDARSRKPVAGASRVTAGRRLAFRPQQRLRDGAYRLDWRSVSTIDGHIREGSIGFGVGTAALGPAVELQQNPMAGVGPARALLRWGLYLSLFFFAGGVLNTMLLDRRGSPGAWLAPVGRFGLSKAGGDPEQVAARAWNRTRHAGRVAAATALLATLVDAADAADALSVSRMVDFLLTGTAGYGRLLTLGALLAAVVLVGRRVAVAAVFVAIALLGIALSGHASAADARTVAVPMAWVHLLAGAVWVGGIAQLAWAWLPALRTGSRELRQAVMETVLSRFGRVALAAFLVVATTGLLNAVIELGALSALWGTAYGRVLALKIGLVAVAALLSYLHAIRLRPYLLRARPGANPDIRAERAHRRALGFEVPVGAVILVFAALLTAFPVPPREVRAVLAAATPAVAACNPCPLPKPAADELAIAVPAGTLTVAAWIRRDGEGLEAVVRILDRKRRLVDQPVTVEGARRLVACGRGCWRAPLPGRPRTIAVRVGGIGRAQRVELPARWSSGSADRARQILGRVQRRMRALDSYRQTETVSSAVSGATPATTQNSFLAPDRTRYTGRTVTGVIIGPRTWIRGDPTLGWQEGVPAEVSFKVRDGFRWTVFAETVRLLDITEQRGRRVAHLALLDWGYPVWYRLTVDLDREKVVEATLTTPENRIRDQYFDFDAPVRIDPPNTR